MGYIWLQNAMYGLRISYYLSCVPNLLSFQFTFGQSNSTMGVIIIPNKPSRTTPN